MIRHVTEYKFDSVPDYGLVHLRQTPKQRPGQTVHSWTLDVSGGSVEAEFEDQNANCVQLVRLAADSRHLKITCGGEVEVMDMAGVSGAHMGYTPLWLFRRTTPLTRPGPLLRKLARSVPDEGADIARLHALSALVHETIAYEIGATDAATMAELAMEIGKGVCQDHAHAFIAAARLLGFPARYVGGYLLMDGQHQQDAGHAWAEAHVEGLGWVGFDISNAISPDERYVRVATGLDYSEASPVKGLRFGDSRDSLNVAIEVQQQ
jgi:transglutaminase-like putative cysteine protease